MGKTGSVVPVVDLQGKTVVVTGANTGIGKETARELARAGARVILACRSAERANAAREDIVNDTNNQNVLVKILDLSSLQSVRDFAVDFNANEDRLDILVNNAGILTEERMQSKDGYEMMFATNHLGPFLLTNLLLDKLKACSPSRIVNVSSRAHEAKKADIADLQSISVNAMFDIYGRTKSMNILFTCQLSKRLEGTGVTVYSLHPGIIKSEFFRNVKCLNGPCAGCGWCCLDCLCRCFACASLLTVEEGAQTSLYCCLEPSIAEVSGRYYSECKEHPAKPHATDPETALKLWQESEKLARIET